MINIFIKSEFYRCKIILSHHSLQGVVRSYYFLFTKKNIFFIVYYLFYSNNSRKLADI